MNMILWDFCSASMLVNDCNSSLTYIEGVSTSEEYKNLKFE